VKILFLDIETVPTDQALQDNGLLAAQMQLDEAERIKKLSLSAATAKILCLAYALDDAPVTILHSDEKEIIQSFWKLAPDVNLFVGHNLLDFDLKFIVQRSIIHQIRPTRELPFNRFRNTPIYDTMQEWSKWGREHVSLDTLAKALGIPSPKQNLDGSKVYPYYRAGRLAEIYEYCKRDVDTVRRVYRRLTFGNNSA
jgi:hypothetical protein